MSKCKDLLVGSTGFVGRNLYRTHNFYAVCHSTDINAYFGSKPDLCVYAGVPSAMFLANSNPGADLAIIKAARENIRKIAPKRLVLISSIAVYQDPKNKDETSIMLKENLSPYGKNRLCLEEWVREDFEDVLIIRLPALYGIGLKKNFLFDLHTIIPAMLKQEMYNSLSLQSSLVINNYTQNENGIYYLNNKENMKELKDFFINNDFNALSFTDSRSRYQFFNLSLLWNDINIGLRNNIDILNICTPPISAKKVYSVITGKNDWKNEFMENPYDYDIKSIHFDLFGGNNGYLSTEEMELSDIKTFMLSWRD